MTRVLFVDDEAIVLRSTERIVRSRRGQWYARYVTSGPAALTTLREEPFDLVVSDIGMPGMDGVELLSAVREEFPQVARFALSGEARVELRTRAVAVVHRWFTKPYPMTKLIAIIDALTAARALVRDAEALRTVAGLACLPSSLRTHADLAAARDRGATADEIAALLNADPALAAKLLQLANNAFFLETEQTTSVTQAAQLLGPTRLWGLLATGELATPSADATAATERALEVSQRARRLAETTGIANQAALAGILHDVATLAMGPAAAARLDDADTALPRLSGLLLAMWGIPEDLVTAVTYQRDPHAAPEPTNPLLQTLAEATRAA